MVANMCGMCVTSTRAKQYWLLPAVRPSSGVHSLLPLLSSAEAAVISVDLLGLLTNDENLKFWVCLLLFMCLFFHCFKFSRLFGERVSNVWIQTSFTAVFKRNHKMWIMVLPRSTSARTRAEDEVLSVLSS